MFLFQTIVEVLFLLLIFSFTETNAQTAARSKTCCGLMFGKIYCYGGSAFKSATVSQVNSAMNVLDLTNKSGIAASDLQNLWTPITYNPGKVNVAGRADPQCVVLEDGKRMIVNGGYDSTANQLINLNFAYDAAENQWEALEDYTEEPYGRRQIYSGSATNIPGKGVAFYGGFEVHINSTWTLPSAGNISMFEFGSAQRYIGYSQVAMFDINNSTNPWSLYVPLTDYYIAGEFSARHQAIFDPTSEQILFMGGEYRTNNPVASAVAIPRPYNRISAVTIARSTWQSLIFTGHIPTQNRIYSTLTLLPSTNRHVLLYGGEVNNAVDIDYCVVLDLENKNWTNHMIDAPADTILARSRHSAVLVNNDTLFIMWGIDSNNVGTSSILILNVSNPENITLSSNYIDPNAGSNTNNNTSSSGGNSDNTASDANIASDTNRGLSSGAKAGIAVACVAVAFLAGIAFWFYLRNKKNVERYKRQVEQQQEDADRQDIEPLEVDWDQIENKYMEMSPRANFVKSSDQISITDNTLVNNTGSPTGFPAMIPDGVGAQRAHAAESLDQPGTMLTRVSKPDGG